MCFKGSSGVLNKAKLRVVCSCLLVIAIQVLSISYGSSFTVKPALYLGDPCLPENHRSKGTDLEGWKGSDAFRSLRIEFSLSNGHV